MLLLIFLKLKFYVFVGSYYLSLTSMVVLIFFKLRLSCSWGSYYLSLVSMLILIFLKLKFFVFVRELLSIVGLYASSYFLET